MTTPEIYEAYCEHSGALLAFRCRSDRAMKSTTDRAHSTSAWRKSGMPGTRTTARRGTSWTSSHCHPQKPLSATTLRTTMSPSQRHPQTSSMYTAGHRVSNNSLRLSRTPIRKRSPCSSTGMHSELYTWRKLRSIYRSVQRRRHPYVSAKDMAQNVSLVRTNSLVFNCHHNVVVFEPPLPPPGDG
ncbi:hypothetical protein EJ06DRAFT_23816 [Trichodelitschia bisporula]|uniref:Uncharacterized protein n=1 Tax=Trichodelitschia bisporula TaxID=703511 RepID=A0A6G1IBL8_9PEZI|nr:hypothetical protein EJ06DRAFT_23816 [Trichodelitschia bisporula]